jgi:hypothetical protein
MKMEQNKIETQIREKLNSRKIKPTEMAWDKLDAMLSLLEENKTKRFSLESSRFIGIAASVLIFLSVGLYFFVQNDVQLEPENSVVLDDKENSIDNNSSKINNQQEQVVKSQSIIHNSQKVSNGFNPLNQKNTESSSKVLFPSNNSNPEKLSGNPEVIAENPIAKITIDEKPIQVKSQLDDIDALLATASKSIKEKSQKSDSKIKINSGALLTQVDEEVDLTFRKKVLNKIANKFEEIKVVITTRNTINENKVKNTQQ